MNPDSFKEVQSLERMTVGELKEKYLDVFDEETRSNNKPFLQKRIAWRIQALAEGVRIYDYAEIDQPQLPRMWNKRQNGYRAMGYRVHNENPVRKDLI